MVTFRSAVPVWSALILLPASATAADELDAISESASVSLPRIWLASPCPGPDCGAEVRDELIPLSQGLRTVYLNFDEVTLEASNINDDARSNISAIVNRSPGETVTLPAFSPDYMRDDYGMSRAEIIAQTLSAVQAMYSPYEVQLTTSRPSSGNYHMIVFSGDCRSVAGTSCAGVSLGDCSDYMPNNISFVFPDSLRVPDMASTAAHEVAHAFGLSHTSDNYDIMYPAVQSRIVPDSFGAGSIPDNPVCDGLTYQDSHQMLLDTIGARGGDYYPPEVSFATPRDGAAVSPGDPVRVSATDSSGITEVVVTLDGALLGQSSSAPFDWSLPGSMANGRHTLIARATDSNGHTATATVKVTVAGGTEPECSNDSDCPDGEECEAGVCVPEGPAPGQLGAVCDDNEDCASGICAELDGNKLCTERCSDSNPCPAGFECVGGGACWPTSGGTDPDPEPDPETDPEPDPDQPGVVSSEAPLGCAVTSSRQGLTLALLSLLGVAMIARRKRQTRAA